MIILASQSPRRKELLRQVIPTFEVIPADIDEDSVQVDDPELLPEKLSVLKAEKVFSSHIDDTVIACDTIVLIDGRIMGKPHDGKQAYEMLRCLSGRTHKVISGYTILKANKRISKSVTTLVTFNKLDDELIHQYVATGSPMDKAGAYGIQDKDFPLVEQIEGSFYNVMGLPVESLKKEWRNI